MIGWTLVALMTIALLLGLVCLGKYVTDSWAKSTIAVGSIVIIVALLMAAIYGAFAMIKAGI